MEYLDVREPKMLDLGICVQHDQACAVVRGKKAVWDMGLGVFRPSWQAQSAGWRLVRARTKAQKFALWLLKRFGGTV